MTGFLHTKHASHTYTILHYSV